MTHNLLRWTLPYIFEIVIMIALLAFSLINKLYNLKFNLMKYKQNKKKERN